MIRPGQIAYLSAEQRDLLALVLDEGPADRFALKALLNRHRHDTVPNTSVYYHLDQLAELEFIEKRSGGRGGNTKNQYLLARDGLIALTTYRNWLDECLDDVDTIEVMQ